MNAAHPPYELRGFVMSLINVSMKHGKTLDEARVQLERAIAEVRARFGAMVHQVDWSPDRQRVTLSGTGFQLEMWVDAVEVHARGDIPILGQLFGGPLATGLKGILEKTFSKALPK